MTKMPTYQPNIGSLVGGNILHLITCGMYATPLGIYREYLQNSADAIASLDNSDNGKVGITINLREFCVMIRDNGPGLSYQQAKQALIPISKSKKHVGRDRGFRGVGRLSGIAFAKSVKFLTRSRENSSVTKVVWNGDQLRSGVNSKLSVEEIISNCVTVEKIYEENYPANFFEVQIEGISRYAATYIMNRNAVLDYLQEVCPVPFSGDFPYASRVENLFGKKPFELDIYLDEDEQRITRPHKIGLKTSPGRLNKFVEFEKIEIPGLGDQKHAAVGWIAHSSYLGAIPQKLGIRCVRARVGNIQVGGENVFDHLFSENRFNRWCVAEINILDSRIVPNGRRDYFELSMHLRNLENRLSAVCRKLERRCRMASQERNRQRQFQFFLDRSKSTDELANSGYLTANVARKLIESQVSEIDDFQKKHESSDCDEILKKLDKIKEKMRKFQAHRGRRSFEHVDAKHVSTYRKIFNILAETSSSPRIAKEMIETILRYKPG